MHRSYVPRIISYSPLILFALRPIAAFDSLLQQLLRIVDTRSPAYLHPLFNILQDEAKQSEHTACQYTCPVVHGNVHSGCIARVGRL